MPFIEFITFLGFAFIGSFTPGPNTTIATATGVNHGLRAAVPQIFGVPIGFLGMLWIIGLGGGAILKGRSELLVAIKLIGIVYLLWLAWRIYFSTTSASNKNVAPFSLLQAAVFQFVNPKAWMIVLAATSTYAIGHEEFFQRMIALTMGFTFPSALSLLMWAWIGEKLRDWLSVENRMRWFNRAMGASLALSAFLMFVQTS